MELDTERGCSLGTVEEYVKWISLAGRRSGVVPAANGWSTRILPGSRPGQTPKMTCLSVLLEGPLLLHHLTLGRPACTLQTSWLRLKLIRLSFFQDLSVETTAFRHRRFLQRVYSVVAPDLPSCTDVFTTDISPRRFGDWTVMQKFIRTFRLTGLRKKRHDHYQASSANNPRVASA